MCSFLTLDLKLLESEVDCVLFVKACYKVSPNSLDWQRETYHLSMGEAMKYFHNMCVHTRTHAQIMLYIAMCFTL